MYSEYHKYVCCVKFVTVELWTLTEIRCLICISRLALSVGIYNNHKIGGFVEKRHLTKCRWNNLINFRIGYHANYLITMCLKTLKAIVTIYKMPVYKKILAAVILYVAFCSAYLIKCDQIWHLITDTYFFITGYLSHRVTGKLSTGTCPAMPILILVYSNLSKYDLIWKYLYADD
jgi:tRNA splicing ligase